MEWQFRMTIAVCEISTSGVVCAEFKYMFWSSIMCRIGVRISSGCLALIIHGAYLAWSKWMQWVLESYVLGLCS